jgi:hypothetical protein
MATTFKQLSALWEAHRARRYPHGRPECELGGADFGDLIELDAFVAGYVSRVVEGEHLAPLDLERLARASLRVRHVLEAMSGETRAYFTALAQLAETAEAGLVGPRT